ncbi:N-6 DNA methylase [Dysgonomonas sp. GY75]|uniref:N-6 DNA methylase n=1 Tax=Dysgonomonas sp. GY75 TaxID=2780419 RepID=UPI0018845652|nr:N-6 DNA methylase [Dysgonomonas sp. GY75]MBF0651544.1 N-6 DNA methylase [Dysgonomonas sp. GY75]
MVYSKKKHLQDNILAIRTALRLRQELRVATAEEKEVLRRYSGFGGLKCILRPHQDPDDKSKWPAGQQELFDDTKLLYGIIGQYSASQEQYKAYCDSLQHSVLTGFYTPPPVAVAIAVALSGMGIKASRILDPSAGTGVFVEAFGQVYPCSPAVCYEKDLLTAEVLSGLYPGDLIHGAGFETIGERSLGYFDIISSNIPFGDYRVYDPVFRDSKDEDKKRCCRDIHSYFFIKAVDAAREGGLIAFITSQGVMNSPGNGYVRRWLMDRCKLVSVIRLPDDLFMDSAGTHAPSDLILLQKDSGKTEQSSREYSFSQTRQLGGIHVNNYHMDFSRVVHTRAEAGTDQYGKPAVNFLYEGSMDELAGQLQAMLREDCALYLDRGLYDKYLEQAPVAEEIPEEVFPEADKDGTPDILPVPGKESSLYDLFGIPEEERSQIIQKQKIKAGTADNSPAVLLPGSTNSDVPMLSAHSMAPRLYEGILLDFYKDGVLVENGGQVGILSIKAVWNPKKQCEENEYLFTPLKLAPEMAGRLKAYIHLREGYFHLHFTETAQRRECPGSRNILNSRYEDFVRAYGDLNSRENYRLLMQDVFGNEILTLEYFEDGKKKLAAIFDHPVAFMTDKALLVEKADEALAASVNKYGGVDLQYMSAISGKDAAALVEELEGSIYYNPLSKAYELPARFIAGDVIAKSEEIAAYIKANPQAGDLPESRKSLEALEKAIPEPVPFSDLCLSLGERWIPACFYNEYASRIFNTPVTVTYIADLDHFHIDAENEYTAEIRKKYAVKPGHSNILCGLTLFWHALVNTFPKVTMPSGRYNAAGKEIRIPDVEATREANAKIDEIREGFGVYLDGLPIEAKGELSTLYNRMFNARVKPRYDGRFQTFPDLQLKELGIDKPYGSQYDTVWMIKLLNGAVVDVEVGGGKTLIMSIAAHELKRLKMAHKPMIIGLKSNIFAIADTYMKAYPNDKALYPTGQDFEPKNRQRLFHKIKNRDWDVIILTHEQFFKIPQSLEIQRDTLQEELDSVEGAPVKAA